MRLAGTWKQYSPSAINQLTRTASTIGADRCFRCPYQAKVMKVFETSRRMTVSMFGIVACAHGLNRIYWLLNTGGLMHSKKTWVGSVVLSGLAVGAALWAQESKPSCNRCPGTYIS